MQNRQLQDLPLHVLAIIASFLTKKELSGGLAYTSLRMAKRLKIKHLKLLVFESKIPSYKNKLCPIKNPLCNKLLTSLPDHAFELPFQGFKTDGGLPSGDLKYWIGKCFSKSRDQMLGTKLLSKVYIQGTLSFDAVVFKQLIVDMAQCLSEDKKRPKFEKLQTALVISKASTWQGIDAIQPRKWLEEYIKYEKNYFETAIQENLIEICRNTLQIWFATAIVSLITISRKGYFLNPIKTVLLMGCTSKFQKLEKSQFINFYRLENVARVNDYFKDVVKFYSEDLSIEYILFKQREDCKAENFPMLWVNFKDNIRTSCQIKIPPYFHFYVRDLMLFIIKSEVKRMIRDL